MYQLRSSFLLALFAMLSVSILQANEVSSTGVGFRGNYWNVSSGNGEVLVRSFSGFNEVEAGGFGGSIYLLSRIDQQSTLEFSFGMIGAVEAREDFYDNHNIDAVAVMPLTAGLRYQILPAYTRSNLQPYVQFGGGAYWISDIRVREDYGREEEVRITSKARPGGYAGFGLDFNLGDHFAINYDLKYHWVDFEREGLQNGFQFGLGLSVLWGSYKY